MSATDAGLRVRTRVLWLCVQVDKTIECHEEGKCKKSDMQMRLVAEGKGTEPRVVVCHWQ